ncbi:MAG: peptidase M6 [Gammaproteobacteria bacterium]
MNFSNKQITRTFTSPHSKNCWAYIDTIGWRKVKPDTTDGSTNMFILLNAARANNRPVTGTIDDASNQITILYL